MFFLELFREQRTKCEAARSFYANLANVTPKGQHWKLTVQNPFMTNFDNMITVDHISQVAALDAVLETLDYLIDKVSGFNDNEFRAFLIGLGVDWIPVKISTKQITLDYIEKIKSAVDFNRNLDRTVPDEDKWSIESEVPVQMMPKLVPAERKRRSEILELIKRINMAVYEAVYK